MCAGAAIGLAATAVGADTMALTGKQIAIPTRFGLFGDLRRESRQLLIRRGWRHPQLGGN